ncbi:MAG: porin [Gemmatimonadota bacterium]
MSSTRRCTVAALAVLSVAAPARAQVRIKSKAEEITLTGRFQLQARTTSCSTFPVDPGSACAGQESGLDWFVRRARLTAEVKINDFIDGKIQPDFGEVDGVELKDAWGRLTFSPGAKLKIGHFKRPFDGFQMTSSTKILTIERDLDVPGVSGLTAASYDEFTTKFGLSDRDLGLMLSGETTDGRFEYWIGTFNGGDAKSNGDGNTEKQLIGRGQVALDAGGHPLALAAAVALTDAPFTRATGERDAEYYTNVELWAELGDFKGGPHVQAGFVLGDNPRQNPLGGPIDLDAGEDFASMYAWQGIGSYRIQLEGDGPVEAIEPLLRVTRAEPNTDLDDDEVWGFTPGVQIFFTGRNKLAFNWDFVTFADPTRDSENSFKAQYQFHF